MPYLNSAEGLNFKSKSDKAFNQIILAVCICYVCICGGNVIGFTSSAIPSMRKGNSNIFASSSSPEVSQNGPLTDVNRSDSEGLGFLVQLDKHLEEIDAIERDDIISGERTEKHEFITLSDEQASWIGGFTPLAAFFGSIFATLTIRYLGPKGTILLTGGPSILVSWIVTALAPSVLIICIGRAIGGIGIGLIFSAAPLYVIETTSMSLRGPLGTLPQFLFTLGVLMSFILGSLFDWRPCALICGILVLPVFFLLPFVPESPIWLLTKNRLEEAERAFCTIHGSSSGGLRFQQSKTLLCLDVNQNTNEKQWDRRSFSEILSPSSVRSSLVAIFLCVFQQLTGINGINFYAVTVFETAAGPDSFLDGHSSSIIIAVVFCFANLCSYFLIERMGRKPLLNISTLLIALSCFVLGSYFYYLKVQLSETVKNSLSFVPLVSLVIFVLAFSIGYGPLLYIIVAEILPSSLRGVVNPFAVGVNWLCVFIVAKSFPGLITVIGAYGAFWMYGCFSVISLFFTIFYLPETKGKTEDEIQRFFGSKCNYSEDDEEIC